MFDVAFSEILVIVVVALIVIGPQKLPQVARMLGALVGRLQRYVATVKADIERELRLEETRRLEQEVRHSILSVQTEIDNATARAESAVESTLQPAAPEKPESS
ncbi:MAG: Sec-independent protein translocase protein TatB [Methylophilaceae bacterium]|nr:Sec-independent protein translocase protein TatB [Methylophilaceae bacterium]